MKKKISTKSSSIKKRPKARINYIDGIKLDSLLEKSAYLLLKESKVDFKVHVPYKIGRYTYIADFIIEANGKTMVVDMKHKTTVTPTFILKKKLMKLMHNIDVTICYNKFQLRDALKEFTNSISLFN